MDRKNMRKEQLVSIKRTRETMLDGIGLMDRETLEDYARGMIMMRSNVAEVAVKLCSDLEELEEKPDLQIWVRAIIQDFLHGASAPKNIGGELRTHARLLPQDEFDEWMDRSTPCDLANEFGVIKDAGGSK